MGSLHVAHHNAASVDNGIIPKRGLLLRKAFAPRRANSRLLKVDCIVQKGQIEIGKVVCPEKKTSYA